MRYPSVKTLMALTGKCLEPRATALAVRKVLDGRTPPESYGLRAMEEGKLAAINKLVDGHGVEYIQWECERLEGTANQIGRFGRGFYFVNFGETYTTTLLYLPVPGIYRVISWGDALEAHERWCGKCRRLSRKGW